MSIEPASPQTTDPDAAKMMRVRAGDEQAFAELLQRYHPEVMNLAWRYFHDRQIAEDIAQETFLRVHAARGSYTPKAKFRTWLLRIASNLCISRLRRKRIQAHSLTGGDEREREVRDHGADDPSLSPEMSETRARVRAAVDRLPERQRMAIVLSRFHGLSYPELEQALDLSRNALKSLLHRARESLKNELRDYMAGDE